MPPVVERNGFLYFELPTGYAAAITRNGVTYRAEDYQHAPADDRPIEPTPGQLVAGLVREGRIGERNNKQTD